MLGDSAVGKTCIVKSAVTAGTEKGLDSSQMATTSTMGVHLVPTTRRVAAGTAKLQIWDTAGQERFRSLAPTWFRGAQGVVLCYDLTRHESFVNVRSWMEDVSRHVGDCAVVLLANKADLASKGRAVDSKAGKAAADGLGVPFFETSAVTGQGIDAAFDALATEMLRRAAASSSGDSTPSAAGGAGARDKRPSGSAAAGGAGAAASKPKDIVDLADTKPVEESAGGCSC